MTSNLQQMASAPKAQQIAAWLLILKPGQCMELDPVTFGVNGDTLQTYVTAISLTGNRRYKSINGVRKRGGVRFIHNHQPVGVRFLGDKK